MQIIVEVSSIYVDNIVLAEDEGKLAKFYEISRELFKMVTLIQGCQN